MVLEEYKDEDEEEEKRRVKERNNSQIILSFCGKIGAGGVLRSGRRGGG